MILISMMVTIALIGISTIYANPFTNGLAVVAMIATIMAILQDLMKMKRVQG